MTSSTIIRSVALLALVVMATCYQDDGKSNIVEDIKLCVNACVETSTKCKGGCRAKYSDRGKMTPKQNDCTNYCILYKSLCVDKCLLDI